MAIASLLRFSYKMQNSIKRLFATVYSPPPIMRFMLSLLASSLVWFTSASLGPEIQGALSVSAFAALLWLTETLPLPVTALMVPVALAAVGVFEQKQAFDSFGNAVIFLVLGGYALGVAVQVNGIDLWLAKRIINLAGTGHHRLLAALMATSAFLSMVISNTATVALLLPVASGILLRYDDDKNLSRLLLLGVAYGASIGGIATLIGSPPNAIAAGLLGLEFIDWVSYGVPVSLIALVLAYFILLKTWPPTTKADDTGPELVNKLSPSAYKALFVVMLTFTLWMFGPSLTRLFELPTALLGSASVAILSLVFMVLLKCVKWEELEHGIHWGVLVLLGGGLTLGRGLTESGAADWLASQFVGAVGHLPILLLLLALVIIAVFATELISNTAVTASLAPILMGVALQLGMAAESLVLPVTIGTSMAFMLPVATPPNAMVHATKKVSQHDMMRVGLRLNLVVISVIVLVFYTRQVVFNN